MKTLYIILLQLLFASLLNAQFFIRQQISLEGNNIRSFIWNSGIFDQDLRTINTPGFEWPKGTGKKACFTTGLTIAGYVNNEMRMGVASYYGEYRPGYSTNGQFFTDSRFRHFKVKRGDNYITNPDWLNWGLMVPYGAPYIDVNNNGSYDYLVDTPGVRSASETVFICITDGDSLTHNSSEGFGGGTKPLFAEVHLTAWCYDNPGFQDMQFLKWTVINKNTQLWDSTIFTIVCDPDLGDATDDYNGCDTSRNLGYCYNADNVDGTGTGTSYGLNPPAFGIVYLNCANSNSKLSSINYFTGTGAPGPTCETDPFGSTESYRYMKGLKRDGTPWVNILTNQITKFCYPGDPETHSGWTEYEGRIGNCGGLLIGPQTIPAPPGDRRLLLSYRPVNQIINPGDTHVVMAAQLMARGGNNLNSVTLLKQLTDVAKNLCQNGFVIGISPISTEIPQEFSLQQNYPNPFNPNTIIRFNIKDSRLITLKLFDILGGEIATLVNEQLIPGTYEVSWNASNFPSGIYFYRLTAGKYIDSKKMVLIK